MSEVAWLFCISGVRRLPAVPNEPTNRAQQAYRRLQIIEKKPDHREITGLPGGSAGAGSSCRGARLGLVGWFELSAQRLAGGLGWFEFVGSAAPESWSRAGCKRAIHWSSD